MTTSELISCLAASTISSAAAPTSTRTSLAPPLARCNLSPAPGCGVAARWTRRRSCASGSRARRAPGPGAAEVDQLVGSVQAVARQQDALGEPVLARRHRAGDEQGVAKEPSASSATPSRNLPASHEDGGAPRARRSWPTAWSRTTCGGGPRGIDHRRCNGTPRSSAIRSARLRICSARDGLIAACSVHARAGNRRHGQQRQAALRARRAPRACSTAAKLLRVPSTPHSTSTNTRSEADAA